MSRRVTYRSVAALLLPAVIVVGVALSDNGRHRRTPRPTPEPAASTAKPAAPPAERELVLVRRRTGLPASWIRRLRRSGAVEALAEGSP
jgi:hypothetical protein